MIILIIRYLNQEPSNNNLRKTNNKRTLTCGDNSDSGTPATE